MTRTAMSSVDRAWLQMDSPTNLMIINGVMTFDDPLDFARVCEVVGARLTAVDRFRQRVVTDATAPGRYYWETDPHFDLRRHIHHIALPEPGDKAALQELVGDLMCEPLDRARPLWQFYVIDNVMGGSALLGRIHHCIADGIALMRVLLSLTDDAPDAPPPEVPKCKRRRATSLGATLFKAAQRAQQLSESAAKMVLREGAQMLENPQLALETAKSAGIITAGSGATLARLLLLPPDGETIFKGTTGTTKKVAWSASADLATVKRIGQMAGATINDVLVAAMAGALRRYLLEKEEGVAGVNIRAMVPVNLRPASDELEMGNKFALVYLSLPISEEAPLDRLFETKRRMDELKSSPDAFVVFQVLNLLGTLPGELADRAVSMFASKATAVLTNVPGPRQTLYFAGRPLRRIMFWVPQSGQIGLGISILSYAGTVTVGLMTDEKMVDDPERIIAHFQAELAEMTGLIIEE